MRTSFHHQPEAQHPHSPAINTPAGRLPHLLLQADKGGDRRRVATQRKPQLLCHLKVIPTNVTQIWVKPKIRPTSHAASAQPALVKKPTQNQTPIW